MASIPEDWQSTGYDESASSEPAPRPVSWFWRYYWLTAGGAGLLGIGLAIAQANPDVAGILFLLSVAMLIVGLIPSLLSTTERHVGHSLTQRMPDYHHQWSVGARRWWAAHWLMLVIILGLIIAANLVPAGGPRDFFVVMGALSCCTYVVMICFVLAWRWRRKRLAVLAGLEELQSFELIMTTEEVLSEMSHYLPILGGKLQDRCPFILRRTLGDWTILLFDWLDINKQPPRREWISVALIGLHQPLPMLSLQPTERVTASQLHWWHIFLEFPFGLIIFIISAVSHVAKQLKSKPPLTVAHSPGLTKGYLLESFHFSESQKLLTPEVCQDIMSHVHKKKRFLMMNQEWLLLASHKKEVAPRKLGELVADAIRLTDALQRAKE